MSISLGNPDVNILLSRILKPNFLNKVDICNVCIYVYAYFAIRDITEGHMKGKVLHKSSHSVQLKTQLLWCFSMCVHFALKCTTLNDETTYGKLCGGGHLKWPYFLFCSRVGIGETQELSLWLNHIAPEQLWTVGWCSISAQRWAHLWGYGYACILNFSQIFTVRWELYPLTWW